MINQQKSLTYVLQENRELRFRLEEAEETLRAIREGEIDGLIVSGSQGEQIFTLLGADYTYRMLIEEMNEGALTLASDGTILYCNRSFATMIKTPQPKIIGSSFFDLVFPSDQPNFQVELARDDGTARGEINLLRGDGTSLPVHFSFKQMWVEGVQNYSLVITDLLELKERASELRTANQQLWQEITDRMQAEAALRQSEEKFSKAFHGIPIMMILATVDEGRCIDCNEALCSGTGYTREEIIDCTIKELNFFIDYGKRMEYSAKLIENGKIENIEVGIRTKTGEILDCVFWSQLVNLDGKMCHITGIIDVTKQKRMEKEISRLDRLNLIGEMAASIGHEIRNPMTTIRGFLQMVNERDDNVKYQEFYELMIEELDRANSIITEYLSMARDKTVELKPRYINSIVKTLFPMIQADASYSDKQVKLELDSPPKLLLDEKEIRQLILNLVRNGLEAMQPGGTLTIGTLVENQEAVLFIKDEGEGLSPSILEKIGTPFLTTKENGTGLGLAVCYSIAARHNAKIEVETGSQGTTFYVRFLQNW